MNDVVQSIIDALVDVTAAIWSVPTFAVLVVVGILFSVWSKFIQYRALTHGVQCTRGVYDDKNDPGAINHFQALSTALSGTVGLGNIGGVAMAIAIGGPGALFWMWMTGFFGMAIKSVEVTLAMLYRDVSDPDNPHGGAMWVITRGLGHSARGARLRWWLGAVFCVTLLIATMTGGNMFQSWNVGDITQRYFKIPSVFTGIVLAVMAGAVIVGGIKRIGDVTGRLVPLMCGMYLIGGVVVLIVRWADIPALLAHVVKEAFSPTEAQGAFIGATMWFGLTTGLQRALFSNEAGQGTSPIAHSAAKTDEPVREGVVAGLEPFIDTCLVCTLTALVILATNSWNRDAEGMFDGEVRLVAAPNLPASANWIVEASTDASRLPALSEPDFWAAGDKFFMLAETDRVHPNTGHSRIKIEGHLEHSPGSDALVIVWSEAEPGAKLLDRGIYRELKGASLTGLAFDRAVPGLGKWLVTITCWLFAISTIISWSYYGEQGTVFLFGPRGVVPFKIIYCVLTVVATLPNFIRTDDELGMLTDLGTGCMLLANVPIIVWMAPQAMGAFRDYFSRLDAGQMRPHAAPPITDVVEGRDVE